jgi:UDP-hydrolysing UDP-N-acetyl-D-glucosamine 2-epimerase
LRTIGIVTVARSDYGIYLPILRRIQAEPELHLHLIVSGMHLSPVFGLTVKVIEQDGFEIGDRVEMLLASDSPEGIAKSIGVGTMGFAQLFARFRPDILLLLGDRFEMLAAAVASLPFAIHVAHIHGGEATEGLIDESIRHSITKMSHLHFVSTDRYRERVIQLGEEPWRVTVSGAPSLDNLRSLEFLDREKVEALVGMSLQTAPLLVTFHPVTLEFEDTARHIAELLAALDVVDQPIVFTHPNADTEGHIIIEAVEQFLGTHPQARAVVNLGTQAYFSLMRYARAMVGNSSSGIIEAASFEVPVVNIGDRQRGRIHGLNVIDVECDRNSIADTIRRAITPEFRGHLAGVKNPYGDGFAAERIVTELRDAPLDRNLLVKRFHDLT